MNWEGVNEFVAVYETGGFTSAAQQLSCSTAQVSRQIGKLENRLGSKLFYRTTRKVSATEAGQIYYQHCRQILDALDDAERALTDLQASPRGRLKITAPVAYGESHITPLLNNFMQHYPELELQCLLTNQTIDLITDSYDLAIRLGRLSDSSMIARRLSSRRLYVCASPDYIHRHGEPHTLSELSHHICLQGTLDYWRFRTDGQERSLRIQGRIRCNSGHALLDAALKGLGIVQLPDYYVEHALKEKTLVSLLESYQCEDEGIWALYPQNRLLSPKVRLLVDYLIENF
ncbi:LysR substrate-binding domain-containing protein [Oceanospirillum linum]|uniref:LysR family transcriptional regulator n=1 Tax=Oceanospirillum linum TaxID=966 RepID=A0A1T1HFU0_OCELI|nr:LysR substrate-binding domain-containing protein [Oceanospirillum linum]OOV88711.1 LysR family transcriptional regulator [Oceanospirillum linum]SEG02014.1 DNA-binding transcriptional regulator, LysR family [Oleiphilus messinensis]SMP21682.1 transcriptional regulator, LysR family [Oceanospirillum linum]